MHKPVFIKVLVFLFCTVSPVLPVAGQDPVYTDVEIRLEYTGSINFLSRASFQNLNTQVGGFSLGTEYLEGSGKMSYSFTADGTYDPRFIELLESTIGNPIVYPFGSSTSLEVIKGTAYEGERLLFQPVNTSELVTTPGFLRVEFGNGVFVTIPAEQTNLEPDARILATTDLETWTEVTVPGYKNPVAVFYLNDLFFVPVSPADGFTFHLLTSTNGVDWTAQEVPVLPSSMFYGEGYYVGISSGGVMRSSDGLSWESSIGIDVLPGVLRGAYNEGLFVATGGGVYPNGVWSSTDGLNWSAADPEAIPGRVTAGPFIAGHKGQFVNYHAGANPAPGSSTAFATANGKLFNFALSGTSMAIYYSDEIDNYVQADTEPALGFNGPTYATYGNGKYVVTGPLMGIYAADEVGGSGGSGNWAFDPSFGWSYGPLGQWTWFRQINGGGWFLVPEGSSADAFFAYSPQTLDWFYVWTALGVYYDFSIGMWIFIN